MADSTILVASYHLTESVNGTVCAQSLWLQSQSSSGLLRASAGMLSVLPPQLTLGPANFQIPSGGNWSWASWMLLLSPSTEHVLSCARVPGHHILLRWFCLFDDASLPGCHPGLCQHPPLHSEDQEHVSEDHVQIWNGKGASNHLTPLAPMPTVFGKRHPDFCFFVCFFNTTIF